MKIRFLSFSIIMLVTGSQATAHAGPQFLKVSTKSTIELSQLIDEAVGSDILFVGETHDVKKQHENQLDLIRALLLKKVPVAIGLEMFTQENQPNLDDWVAGTLQEKDFKPIYARNWSYDWMLYRDIFICARDNHIPMIALNIPKPVIAGIMSQGSSMPNDTSLTLNNHQTEYLRRIYSQVFGNKPVPISFENFCKAQALRNHGMAWSVAKFKERNPRHKIVVIAGTWHAIKNGVPEQLSTYGNLSSAVILPELPEFNVQKISTDEADYIMLK